ncbi:MAG: Crp/Fnr family transcriptional regulator [Pseudomonadota bacterium]|nr:Crp/Fnr family transcriptional regulator [Pseudomonadota bacterium]
MSTPHSPLQNCLLAALPGVVQNRLFPLLKLATLPLGKVLYEPSDTLRHAYFPTDSIVSLLYTMENGSSGEIAVVGREGVVGVSLFMGGQSTSSRAIVQSAGSAYALPRKHFQNEFNRHGEMMMLLLRYTQSLLTQMTQTAACNRHHSIDEQMARWLLLSLDRLSGNKMKMTEQLIANMLSVSCARVTEVAGKLQKLGVIKYQRGLIEVLNRRTLEKLSCECYAVVRNETDRLLECAPVTSPRTSPSRVTKTERQTTD